MEPGKLNLFCSIQASTTTADGDVWAEVRKQWLAIEPLSVREINFLSSQGYKVTHRVKARELPALVGGQRVVYGSEVYNLSAPLRYRGDRQEALAEIING